jgi:hypothetical protein
MYNTQNTSPPSRDEHGGKRAYLSGTSEMCASEVVDLLGWQRFESLSVVWRGASHFCSLALCSFQF